MFETAELGQKIPKKEFKSRERELWTQLLQVQQELRQLGRFQVIIDFAGVHGGGKVAMLNQLNRWMDARWLITRAFQGEVTQEESERPPFWRYWLALPPKGQIGMYLSGRYSQPLLDQVYEKETSAEFDRRLGHINAFEKALADDGALLIKFWMHLSKDAQKRIYEAQSADPDTAWQVTERDWKNWNNYDRFIEAAQRIIARTSTGEAAWHIVEGEDTYFRSLRVGEIILDSISQHLEDTRIRDKVKSKLQQANGNSNGRKAAKPLTSTTVLGNLDMTPSLSKADYREELKAGQGRLAKLQREAVARGISTVLVFEGPDAAGKGGAIRRLTGALDASKYRIWPFAAPTDEEKAQHYLWRFWRCMPRAGRFAIFDRSWYGRVLVERVEGLATRDEWQRAYAEINDFEAQLVEGQLVLAKFWIHITAEEQLNRFKAREKTPHKRWKLTEEDWRNREKWGDYEMAAHDMIQRTNTPQAPWIMVEGNSKPYARIKVIRDVCDRLEQALAQ
ncbi:MAG: polyphosphate:AMP phosphotransferase [Xanthomonadales bacterium]|nr:polyphosphate:AMP phosphotransferase [Xanthomonadales bacterium]